jgi:hypothetical protein
VIPGGPIRTFEVVRLAEYASSGQRWLGMASLSGGDLIQPVAGPLAEPGLMLEFLGGDGALVLAPSAVRSVEVTLVGATERKVPRSWTGGANTILAETLSTRVFLRNTPR